MARRITFDFDERLIDALNELARVTETKRAQCVRQILRDFLTQEGYYIPDQPVPARTLVHDPAFTKPPSTTREEQPKGKGWAKKYG